jgi:hypothetical protein
MEAVSFEVNGQFINTGFVLPRANYCENQKNLITLHTVIFCTESEVVCFFKMMVLTYHTVQCNNQKAMVLIFTIGKLFKSYICYAFVPFRLLITVISQHVVHVRISPQWLAS